MWDELLGSALARWKGEATELGVEPATPSAPLHFLYEDALAVARFHARYWTAERSADGVVGRRGLEQAVGAGVLRNELNERTGADIRSLVAAVQEAHVAYLLRTEPLPASPAERGRFVLSEITAALEWLFDDGVEEDDSTGGRVGAARDEAPETVEELAFALEDYSRLAEPYREAIDGIGGFDAALVDEAREIAAALRAHALPSPPSPETAAALALRGKLITLLLARMELVRAAARFVFRDDPEILREATSAYEPRVRAAARRAAARRSMTPRAAVSESATLERSRALRERTL